MDDFYNKWQSLFTPRREMKMKTVMYPMEDDSDNLLSVNYDPREGLPVKTVNPKNYPSCSVI